MCTCCTNNVFICKRFVNVCKKLLTIRLCNVNNSVILELLIIFGSVRLRKVTRSAASAMRKSSVASKRKANFVPFLAMERWMLCYSKSITEAGSYFIL